MMKYTFEDMHDLLLYFHQGEDCILTKFMYFHNTLQGFFLAGLFNKGIDTKKRFSKPVRTMEKLCPEVLRALGMPEEDLIMDINVINDDAEGIVRKWRLERDH